VFLPLRVSGNAERDAEHAEVQRHERYRWLCPPHFGVELGGGTTRRSLVRVRLEHFRASRSGHKSDLKKKN